MTFTGLALKEGLIKDLGLHSCALFTLSANKYLVFRLELVSSAPCNFTNEGQKSLQPNILQTANIRP